MISELWNWKSELLKVTQSSDEEKEKNLVQVRELQRINWAFLEKFLKTYARRCRYVALQTTLKDKAADG
jgi:hypothetical protein